MNLQILGGRGGKSGRNNSNGGSVHGVPQSQIDKLRGTRDHVGLLTFEDVREDYAKVGITVTDEYAKEVHEAVQNYTGSYFTSMRSALLKERAGENLNAKEQQILAKYKKCEEYLNIAPTYLGSEKEIYRGVYVKSYPIESKQYVEKLRSLKPGYIFDVDKMPTSFSTSIEKAKMFSSPGDTGVLIHLSTNRLKNSPSISGISLFSTEKEVLVGDYEWKVKKIVHNTKSKDGYYHLYLM